MAGVGLILCLVSAGAASPDRPSAQSLWAPTPVAVDGRADDWAGDAFFHDKKSGADVAFRNDGRDLYVLVVLKDAEVAKTLRATGLKIFGRPAKPGAAGSGVLFVAREVSAEAYIGWQVSQGAVLSEADKAALRKAGRRELDLAFAVGVKGSIYGPIGQRAGVPAPEFAPSRTEAGTIYEFRIPLAPPQDVSGAIAGRPGETLRISFDWGGRQSAELSTPASRERQGSNSGYVSGTGRTWSQEFLDTFDAMSRPTSGMKTYSFSVDVKLAEPR
jgi:hypothetical protein